MHVTWWSGEYTRTACLLLSLCTLTGSEMWQGMLFQDCMLHPERPEWSTARLFACS